MLTTNTLLLQGLGDPANDAIWSEFDGRYRPILTGFSRRLGLSEQDAEEAAQDALLRFASEVREGRYDPARGRLRSWLFAIARARIHDLRRRRRATAPARGHSVLDHLEDDDHWGDLFEAEWRRAVLRHALSELREDSRLEPTTRAVVDHVVVENRPPKEVAAELGLSLNAVYIAKHRSLERLRAILQRLEDEF